MRRGNMERACVLLASVLVVLLALPFTAHAGGGNVLTLDGDFSCCVRSFVRSTPTGAKLANDDIQEVTVDVFVNPRGADGTFGEFDDNYVDPEDTRISNGVVKAAGTMCVDTSMNAFDSYVEFFDNDVRSTSLRDVEEGHQADGRYECPYRDGVTVIVKSRLHCNLLQACNNEQVADQEVTPCFDACREFCSGPFFGKMRDVKGEHDGTDTSVRGCFQECNEQCEWQCSGICFNDPECVRDCVYDSATLTHSHEGAPFTPGADTPFGYKREFLMDFLFGAKGSPRDFYDNEGSPDGKVKFRGSPKKRSMERPTMHVRSGELEATMSLFPDKCDDIQRLCRTSI